MVQAAWSSVEDADCVALVVDAAKKSIEDSERILEALEKKNKRVLLILNKVDLVTKESLLRLAQTLQHPNVQETFMISALTGDGVAHLLSVLSQRMPEGVWLFPEDQLSDIPMRMLAAEVTREVVFHRLHQELPYSIMVETENWEEFDNGDLKIDQLIYVQRQSQKGIVVGKGGQQIKTLGELAREQMSEVFERKVHLKLLVKVKEDWMERPHHYRMIGLDFNAE